MLAIEVLDVSLPEIAHEARTSPSVLWGKEQMNVVGHEAVRVQAAARSFRQLSQVEEVQEVIALVSEAGLSVIATLDNVNSDVWHDKTGLARHSRRTDGLAASLTEIGL